MRQQPEASKPMLVESNPIPPPSYSAPLSPNSIRVTSLNQPVKSGKIKVGTPVLSELKIDTSHSDIIPADYLLVKSGGLLTKVIPNPAVLSKVVVHALPTKEFAEPPDHSTDSEYDSETETTESETSETTSEDDEHNHPKVVEESIVKENQIIRSNPIPFKEQLPTIVHKQLPLPMKDTQPLYANLPPNRTKPLIEPQVIPSIPTRTPPPPPTIPVKPQKVIPVRSPPTLSSKYTKPFQLESPPSTTPFSIPAYNSKMSKYTKPVQPERSPFTIPPYSPTNSSPTQIPQSPKSLLKSSVSLYTLPGPQKPALKPSLSTSLENISVKFQTLPTSNRNRETQIEYQTTTVPRASKSVRFKVPQDNGDTKPPFSPLLKQRSNAYKSMPSLNSPTEREVLRTSLTEIPSPSRVEYTTIQSPPGHPAYHTSFAPTLGQPSYNYYSMPGIPDQFHYPPGAYPPFFTGKPIMSSGVAYIPVPMPGYSPQIPPYFPQHSSLSPPLQANLNLQPLPYPPVDLGPSDMFRNLPPQFQPVPFSSLSYSSPEVFSHSPLTPPTREQHPQRGIGHLSPATSDLQKPIQLNPVPKKEFLDEKKRAYSVMDLYKPAVPQKPTLKKSMSKSDELLSKSSDKESPPPPPVNYATLPKSPITPSWEEIFQMTPALPGSREPETLVASDVIAGARRSNAKIIVKV